MGCRVEYRVVQWSDAGGGGGGSFGHGAVWILSRQVDFLNEQMMAEADELRELRDLEERRRATPAGPGPFEPRTEPAHPLPPKSSSH
jgi:hypothetical protein